MILQSLHGYYERMCADLDSGMPPYGMSMEDISFALVLDAEGKLQGIDDLRELEGKKLRPRKRLVPIPEKKPESVNKCCQRCWLEISTIFFENPGDFRPENFQLKDNCRFASSENRLFAVFRRTTPRNAA